MPKTASGNGHSTHLDEVRAAEALIEEVEHDRDVLRRVGRAAVGVDGYRGVEPVRALAAGGRGHLVAATVGLSVAAGLPFAVLALLGLPLAAGLGLTADLVSTMAGTFFVGTATGALVAPGLARSMGDEGDEYARVTLGGTLLIGVGLALVGLLTPAGGMSVAGLGVGLSTVGRTALIARSTHAAVRVRGLAALRAGVHGGVVLATLAVGLLSFGTNAPISGLLLGLCLAVSAAMAYGLDLASTPVGDGDLARLRGVVDATATGDDAPTPEPFRRVWAVPTLRWLLFGYAVIGVSLVTLHVYLVRFLTLESGLGLWGRGAVYGAVALAGMAAVWLSADRDESRFRDDPARLASAAATALAAAGVALFAAAVWPWYSRVLLVVAAFALVGVAHAQMDALLVGTVRPRLRGHAIAIAVGMGSLAGAALSVPLLAAVARRAGTGGVLVTTALLLLVAAATTRRARAAASGDVDAAVDDEIEATEVGLLVSRSAHLPLLACRHIDFSYGSVQVLFDVSFAVDDGEMVGLLGTNGAGKSTLLRVISGLGTPTSGTVRQRGEDITYLDPAARVGRGITQIPGGKAVFGPLSVVDNLRVFGHSLGRDRKAVDRGIELSLETFPRLGERRNLPSRILSGGERQMLALSKALILEPKLLLIDELSLGLAPVIVGQLLDMVRRINERGTAVVLVEQSVNVALSLVQHAYYMEKGEIRFDGAAEDLLARPDLLRSVYLQGAAEGLA